ncbi:MAG: MlaD family protein [Gemmatimonadales bacterium]|nr:MlaD family protein [Gemmatimonadales bacterium]
MKGRNELLVGLTVLVAIAVTAAGALWLGQADLRGGASRHVARFKEVGGLNAGAPVTLRGVRVGKVEAIRLGRREWVETVLLLDSDSMLPRQPAVIAAAKSLFGEWEATIVPLEPLPDDPAVRSALLAARDAGRDAWPGATLPDIGQLTAQASRIAGDVSQATGAINEALDKQAVTNFKTSVRDLARVADRLQRFAASQVERYDSVGNELHGTTTILQKVATRLDSATARGELDTLSRNAAAASSDIRQAAADLRSVVARARENEASLVRVVQTADQLLQRIDRGQGTLGMLATDSTLYREATLTMQAVRALIADIQANPKRYLKLSLF